MATAAKISIAIEAQTATLQKGFAEAKRAINNLDQSMTSHVAGGLAKFQAAWLALQGTVNTTRNLLSSFFQGVDEMSAMQDWADRLGIAADDLAALGYAAQQTGASQDVLNSALEKMANNLSDAGQEGGAAVKALKELGISASNLRSMIPIEQFRAIADAMLEVDNQGDRTRLTLDIFGKSGGALTNLLREGSAGLAEYAHQAEQLGLKMGDARKVVENFGDELAKAQTGWKSLKERWVASWAIVLTDQTSWTGKVGEAINKALFTQFESSVGSMKVLAKKAAREAEAAAQEAQKQVTQTEKVAAKAAETVKRAWADIPKPQDFTTPSIGAVTRASSAGFSAVQEALRQAADNRRWQQEMLRYQAEILAATKGNKVRVQAVTL